MQIPADIQEYLQLHATEMGERILSSYPALQSADDDLSPLLERMLRRPLSFAKTKSPGTFRSDGTSDR